MCCCPDKDGEKEIWRDQLGVIDDTGTAEEQLDRLRNTVSIL